MGPKFPPPHDPRGGTCELIYRRKTSHKTADLKKTTHNKAHTENDGASAPNRQAFKLHIQAPHTVQQHPTSPNNAQRPQNLPSGTTNKILPSTESVMSTPLRTLYTKHYPTARNHTNSKTKDPTHLG